jgi:hypothetical protein
MLQLVKRLFPFFMSAKPPYIHSLLPQANDDVNVFYWCSRILGQDVEIANICFLNQLDHCKADKPPKHEFLKVFLTLHLNGEKYEVYMIIHRTPARNVHVEENPPKPQRSSTTSLAPQSAMSSRSSSPSPSTFSDHFLGMLGKGDSVPANDRVIVIRAGQGTELHEACTETFGSYITLNTLSIGEGHTAISAPQLATILEVAHNIAPNYTLKKHQCYWFALIVFLIVKKQTKGAESNECIKTRGKLWFIAPMHSADDDENVVQDEYDNAWRDFKASFHLFVAQAASDFTDYIECRKG